MKTILITGTSSGLGLELTKCYLNKGYKVIGISRKPTDISDVRFTNILLDLSDPTSLWGLKIPVETIDGVIFNAGHNSSQYHIERVCVNDITTSFNVHVVSNISLFQILQTKLSCNCFFVAISSRLGSIGMNADGEFKDLVRPPAYKITKAAMNMMMLLIKEMRPDSKVIVFHPGLLNTKMGSNRGVSASVSADNIFKTIESSSITPDVPFIDALTNKILKW